MFSWRCKRKVKKCKEIFRMKCIDSEFVLSTTESADDKKAALALNDDYAEAVLLNEAYQINAYKYMGFIYSLVVKKDGNLYERTYALKLNGYDTYSDDPFPGAFKILSETQITNEELTLLAYKLRMKINELTYSTIRHEFNKMFGGNDY